MFPTSTQKRMVAKAPAPTFDQVLTLLIGAFEKKLEARRRDEAERAAAVERERMENLAKLDRQVAAARAEFETLDEQVRQVVAVLERANLGDEIERHIAKTMPPHQLENFQRLRSLATATIH